MKLEHDDVQNSLGLMEAMNCFVNHNGDEMHDEVNYKDVPEVLRAYLPLLEVSGYLYYSCDGSYRLTPKGKGYLKL